MLSSYSRPLLIALVFMLAAYHAQAADLRPFEHHVRTDDPSLRALVRHGVDTSPAFFALVDSLTRTDVIVYMERYRFPHPHQDGALSFIVASGGVRYLKVQIAWDRPAQRQLAAIAHELQHATEIAETPAIVDSQSMAEEYGRRIGYETGWHPQVRRFESQAAIEAGKRVWREYGLEY